MMDKVHCPWCGREMKLEESLPFSGVFAYVCECGAVSPNENGAEEALKAALKRPLQKPLTLEEACGSEEPCVFIELLKKQYLYAADVIREEYDTNVCFCTILGGDCFKNANDYNITWRCWAMKPTDEERMAAKWDE